MNIIFEGELFNDFLDAYIPKELLKIADDLVDIQLKGRIAIDDFIIRNTYLNLISALKYREYIKNIALGKSEIETKDLLRNRNLEAIFNSDFIIPHSIEQLKNEYKCLTFEELMVSLETTIKHIKKISEIYNIIEEKSKTSKNIISSEILKVLKLQVDVYINYIIIKVNITKKIIILVKEAKLSPEYRQKYIELHQDHLALIKDGAHTRNPDVFYKKIFKIEKFQNWRFGDPVPDTESEDLIQYDHMFRNAKRQFYKQYLEKTSNYIISESTIDDLFNKYGKFWEESLNSWRVRFLNIEEMLPDISTIEPECKFNNNRHLLISILSIIHEKNKKKKKEEKILNFNEYALNRWGIKSFTKTKCRHFSKKYSSINHPEKENIEKMI